jgi:hypothetical protein
MGEHVQVAGEVLVAEEARPPVVTTLRDVQSHIRDYDAGGSRHGTSTIGARGWLTAK